MKVEPIKQEKFDTGINTKFMDYIDVPASSKKDFKLAFYAYKESFTTMKVCYHWILCHENSAGLITCPKST